MVPLIGEQLSMLPEVLSYPIENPPVPGERMTTRCGTAIVTRIERVGEEIVVWGDYGSGIEQPHGREGATCDLKIVLGGGAGVAAIADTNLVIDGSGGDLSASGFQWEKELWVAESSAEKTVLGGETEHPDSEADRPSALADPLAPKLESKACGWIGWKTSKRERKRRDPWICRQAWLYWEEPGGKKRSRYIPKAKLAEVERSVYELRQPIDKTLKLLQK